MGTVKERQERDHQNQTAFTVLLVVEKAPALLLEEELEAGRP